MSEPDFNSFLDDLILEAAARQSGAQIVPLDFFDLCCDVFPSYSPTWRDMALDRLTDLGWATFKPYSHAPGRRALFITHAGISRASEVRMSRRKPSVKERITSIPIGKGVWDIAKLVIGAALGWFGKSYFGT